MSEEKTIEIVENFKYMKDMLEKYSDVKDLLEDEILKNELVELGGDCFKVAKYLFKGKKIIELSMFKYFLKGFYMDEDVDEYKLEKLQKYIDNEEKAIFIGKTVEKILASKSKYAVFILGYITNTLIINQENLDPKYIVLADSLTYMFDHDILNIRFIGDYCNYKIYDDRKTNNLRSKRSICINKKFIDILEQQSIEKDILILTLEKCISYQLIRKDIDASTSLDLSGLDITYNNSIENGNLDLDSPSVSTGMASADTETKESYEMTVIGNLLYEMIMKLKIE